MASRSASNFLRSSITAAARPALFSARLLSTTPAFFDRISKTIADDHAKILEAHQHIINAKDADEKTRWQNQFVWQLARHSISEELTVYPAFEKWLADEGKEMADSDRREHQELKDKLFIFQAMNCEKDDNFDEQLKSIKESLDHHIKDEEQEDMPKLDKVLSEQDSEALSVSFDRHKAIAPSRSHPNAPDKPPMETVAGLFAAPLDHIGDLFRKFPDNKISPNPSKK